MFALPRPPAHRPPVAVVLLLALLLPLIVACGGAATTPQPASLNNGIGGAAPSQPPVDALHSAPPAEATTAPSGAPAPEDSAALVVPPIAAAQPTTASAASGDTAAEAPAMEPAGGAAPIIAAQPTAPPPERLDAQQQYAPLKAGDVDDNADFAAYQSYLRDYSGPPARPVDVTERYILTVVNDRQQPVLDARVRLFDGAQQVFEGRTYAGGKTIVFPRALGVSSNTTTLRVQIDKGNSSVEGKLQRGQDSTQSFVLPGAAALPQTPRLDVLFLLDSTGSMGDEIAQIQSTIASIAERIGQIQPRPDLRFGLVAYRDRGDEYVTQVYDFTPDVQSFRQSLLSISAGGGGDTPESLNEGLHDAVQQVAWARDAVRLTFLVADAPPHLDYEQDYDYVQETRAAVAKGVKIYTIAASNSDDQAEYVFRQLAQQTLAHFIFLTYQPGQNAGAPGDTTTHHVDPQSFSVERLDDLVVQAVQRELAQAQGAA